MEEEQKLKTLLQSHDEEIEILSESIKENKFSLEEMDAKVEDIVNRVELQQVENNKVMNTVENLQKNMRDELQEKNQITHSTMQQLEGKINSAMQISKSNMDVLQQVVKNQEKLSKMMQKHFDTDIDIEEVEQDNG